MRMAIEERGAGPAVVLVHLPVRDRGRLGPRRFGPGALPVDTLDEMGIDRAALVGDDFGGPVVAELTRLRPGLATHVAFVASNLLDDTPIDFPLSLVLPPLAGAASHPDDLPHRRARCASAARAARTLPSA
jgi:pimeloyl-ACP methyl ester carboxylesterase